MAEAAKAMGLKVYGGTLTPFKGNGYYSTANEKTRSDLNAWIRTTNVFDAVIDFDKFIRNPSDTAQMRPELSNDGLHPNVEGYKVMGQSIDVKLFTPPVVGITSPGKENKLEVDRRNDTDIMGLNSKGEFFRINGQSLPNL
jgi:hypothetical protein